MRLVLAVCLAALAVALPKRELEDANLAQLIARKKNTFTQAELLGIADVLQRDHEAIDKIEVEVEDAQTALNLGAVVIQDGICNFEGFCVTNPAASCDDIITQPGINASIATLPDGLYWINIPNGQPMRLQCKFYNGSGWLLLFDDSRSNVVAQQPVLPLMQSWKFREMLAFTPKALRGAMDPIRQYVYYVDELHPELSAGRTFDELLKDDWAGQDRTGAHEVPEGTYPGDAKHYQFKHFGKPVVDRQYEGTIFVLDDGEVKDPACLGQVSIDRCGKDYTCDRIKGIKTVTGRIAQTTVPQTPFGVLSLGCTVTMDSFTHCGSCTYSGPATDAAAADLVQSKIIQVLYVK